MSFPPSNPPGPTAAAVALTVRAPQAPWRVAPGPMTVAVALTVQASQAPRQAAPGPTVAFTTVVDLVRHIMIWDGMITC